MTNNPCDTLKADSLKEAVLRELDYIAECAPHKKGTVLGNRFDRVRDYITNHPSQKPTGDRMAGLEPVTDERRRELRIAAFKACPEKGFYLFEDANRYETSISICQKITYDGQPAMRVVADFDGHDREIADKCLAALSQSDPSVLVDRIKHLETVAAEMAYCLQETIGMIVNTGDSLHPRWIRALHTYQTTIKKDERE